MPCISVIKNLFFLVFHSPVNPADNYKTFIIFAFILTLTNNEVIYVDFTIFTYTSFEYMPFELNMAYLTAKCTSAAVDEAVHLGTKLPLPPMRMGCLY